MTDLDKTKKVYGAYIGSYDGGGVGSPLYLNIEDARAECLELVKGVNKDNAMMLRLSLEGAKTPEEKAYYRKQYPKMKESRKDYWHNKFDNVTIVEYEIASCRVTQP